MSTSPVYDFSRSTPQYYTTLTPYLQLSHLLSLTWLAYPILSLLFIAVRLQLSSASAQDAVASAKGDLLTACQAAERAATAAASLPRYMASATNVRIAHAINDTMDGARQALILALTVMEVIINFIVDTYCSTFLCFLELVVRGALSLLIGAVQEFNDLISGTLSSVRTGIQSDISKANSAIQSAVDAFNKVNPFGAVTIPQFTIPSLDALQNVTLPTNFQDALVSLNNSLPSLSELKQEVDKLIDTPFELLKQDINQTFTGLSFDSAVLPVPAQNTVTFCGDMDTSIIDDLGRDLVKITRIGILILIALALLLIAGNCLLEWYKWRCLKRHLRYTREAWTTDPTLFHGGSKKAPTIEMSDHNLLMLQATSSHPLLMKIANRIQRFLRLSPSQYIHLQWFFHYVFHPPALACFLIGFFGLLSVELQLLAIGPLEHQYTQQAVASVNDFSNTIATSINASMYNQSAAYANAINTRVDTIQTTVNDGLFGWVNGTTTQLNETINAFYTDIQNAVNTVFNGTVLDSPIQEFLRCILGTKIDAIENALTFLHNNLDINIPRVNDSVLVLSPDSVREATQPIADAAIGGTNGDSDNKGLVGRLVASYVKALKKERFMFGIFLGLWGIVVFMACCIIFWHSYGKGWVEAYKKKRWQKRQRAGIEGVVVPFRYLGNGVTISRRTGEKAHDDVDEEKSIHVDLPAFTPLPSPKPGLFNNLRSPAFRDSSRLQPPAPQHPLATRNSEFQKSWESLMDQANPTATLSPDAKPAYKISAPMKLRAIGKKSGDGEEDEEDEERDSGSWLGVFTGAFWKREQAKQEQIATSSPLTERSRPPLSITVPPTVEKPRSPPRVSRNTLEAPIPSSAWSVSPRKHSWIPVLPSLKSLHRKSRRTASVPSDVHSIRDSYTVPIPPQPELRFAVPLHHGFEHPVPPTITPPAPPPMVSPVYGQVTPNEQGLTSPHDSSRRPPLIFQQHTRTSTTDFLPPVTRLTHPHARRSTQVVNPFVTPFDDEYQAGADAVEPSPVYTPTASSVRKSSSTNPFIAM